MVFASNSQYTKRGRNGREPGEDKPVEIEAKGAGNDIWGGKINDLGIEQQAATANIQQRLPWKEGQEQRMSSYIQFETFEHERKNVIPIFKDEITQQGIHVLKKGFASSQSLSDRAVLLVHQV